MTADTTHSEPANSAPAAGTTSPAPPAAPGPPRPRPTRLWTAAALALAALALLVPGDVAWVNDEPTLVRTALAANQAGQLADHGIMGSRGVAYGPAPVWFYQAALALSRDLVLIAWAKCALSLGLSLAAAWLLLRRARLPADLGLLLCATSPCLFLYHRSLWDNVLLVPLSGAFALAVLQGLHRPRELTLAVAAGLAVLMILVHPVALAPVAGAALAAGLSRRAWLRTRPLEATLAAVALAGAVAVTAWIAWRTQRPAPPLVSPMAGLGPWVTGGLYFSGAAVTGLLGWDFAGGLPGWARVGVGVLQLAAALAWAAAALGVGALLSRFWQRRGRLSARVLRTPAGLALLILGVELVEHVVARADLRFHYTNATWWCWLLPTVLGLRIAARRRWGRVLVGVCLAGNLALAPLLPWVIHRQGGTVGPEYGPTLANQIAVVHDLARYAPESRIQVDVVTYRLFPHALYTLLDLYADPAPLPGLRNASLAIEPATDSPHAGHIRLRELPPPPAPTPTAPTGTPSGPTRRR